MTQISFDKNTVIKEIMVLNNMNTAHAIVAFFVYVNVLASSGSLRIFFANWVTTGVVFNDKAKIAQTDMFINTG